MTDEFWNRVGFYVVGPRSYYEKLEPDYEGAEYKVCANVWSEEVNDYIAHFDGETFDNYEFAYDFWAGWMPDMDEVRKAIREFHKDGYSRHYEVEVGIWEDGELTEEDDFYTETVRW